MRVFAVIAVLGLTACPSNPCTPGGDPQMVIGTGDLAYQAMPAELELIHGQQGGYHVVLGFQMTQMLGDELIAGTVTGALNGQERASTSPWLQMSCVDRKLESHGTNLIFRDDFVPEDAIGQSLSISATFDDLEGNTVSGSTDVLIIDTVDENPEEEPEDTGL